MENVVLTGFDDKQPGNIRWIIARLADCGSSEGKMYWLVLASVLYTMFSQSDFIDTNN
jgi:hypothetical protein